jgi:hypothetical protein
MKFLKISLLGLGLLIILFLTAAFLIPRLYKEELLEVVREQANQNLNATLDFKDLNISLLRQFPLLSLRLDELSITGKDGFEGYPLLRARDITVAVSVWDLFKKDAPLNVRRLHLNQPEIRVLVLEDGRANYDITLPDSLLTEEEAEAPGLGLNLRDYSVRDGQIRYEDRSMPVLLEMTGFNHRGSGDFGSARFDLATSTSVDGLTLRYDGNTWFKQAKASMEAKLAMDMENMRFTFKDNTLKINELNLTAEGLIELPEEDITMDLRIKAPDNRLRDLWSIIPGAYTADFADLESSGTFNLDFWIKGVLSEETIPSFGLTSTVSEGRIKYPSLSFPIEQIDLDLAVRQPAQSLEALEIDLPRFRLSVNKQEVNGTLRVRDPMRDPDVKLNLDGTLDLADWRKAFPVDAQDISGRIAANIRLAARMSALDEGRYADTDIKGEATFSNIRYQSPGQPPIQVSGGTLRFNPEYVDARDFRIQAGRSDLVIDARIDNILAFLHPERTLKGRVTLRSNLLDLNEWSNGEPANATALPPDEGELAIGLPTEQFDLALDAGITRLLSGDLELRDLKIIGEAGPQSLKAREVSGRLGQSDFFISGQLENLFGWISGGQILRGDINLRSRLLDLNELMPKQEAGSPSDEKDYAAIPVPADVQVRAKARIDQLRYTDLDLRNLEGSMAIGDQTVLLENLRAEGLGGRMEISGAYVARNIEQPEFHFRYDLQQLDFRQVFQKINTFRQLAPVGEYLQGRFSSNMVIDGAFDRQMNPLIGSINAAGFLETFNTLLKGFKPLEGLADKLNIAELRSMDLKNSKNWFEIINGMVELKEFDYQFKDIAMRIGGRHSLEQDMDYQVKARIPRKYLDKTGLTAQANSGLKWVEAEAAKKGLRVSMGEFINLAIAIGGRMNSPTYALRILGTEGEAGTSLEDQALDQLAGAAEKVRDTLTEAVRKRAEELEAEARQKAQAQLDSLKRKAESQVDTALARAKEEAAKKIGDEAAKKLEELGGDKSKQEADKLKEQIKKWDPLGRKRD